MKQYGPISTEFGPQGALLECFNMLAANRRGVVSLLADPSCTSAYVLTEISRRHEIHIQHIRAVMADGSANLDAGLCAFTARALDEYENILDECQTERAIRQRDFLEDRFYELVNLARSVSRSSEA